MKLGNISQSIVPVPYFFMDQKTRPLETFQLYNKTDSDFYKRKKKSGVSKAFKNCNTQINLDDISTNSTRPLPNFSFKRQNSYYRDRDVLTTFYNLNINHNPRTFSRQWLELNKEKYIPVYHQKNYPDLTKMKRGYFPDIVDVNNVDKYKNKNKSEYKKMMSLKCMEKYYNWENYKKAENLEEFLEPNLREDIKNNTQNLIDKINMNYDIKQWTDFDSRVTHNRFFQTVYSPLTNVIKNEESLKDKFGNVLKQKALSLKNITEQTRKVIEKNMKDNKKEEDYLNNQDNDILSDENYYNTLLDNCNTNLLKLRYNNSDKHEYNSKDQNFIDEHQYLTSRLNKTKLFKDFPSKTREEFNEKKIIIPKSLQKVSKYNGKVILKDKYGKDKDDNVKIEEDYLKLMWKRPLHKDAYKLHE